MSKKRKSKGVVAEAELSQTQQFLSFHDRGECAGLDHKCTAPKFYDCKYCRECFVCRVQKSVIQGYAPPKGWSIQNV